ncbi:hypothetical protein DTO166G4_8462 [Paecilomyces variotii]|nr:hypothetical protein DTO166G4_8462 [Paecilomyces variotii]KAJ9238610.1 hypothetical protein DTO166G5_2731 [Paecilomyces variotii]KAJ9246773.1 hypothetical protein DTO207G8_8614 [Paecilomyces variotii]KAJ9267184.1 hypothetical protein DTO195F2_417 [Paecilomyces variotii]KAJ9364369.1 hypothetical protein DTO280E4_1615 [Paecilomyces variotii]
MEEAEKDISEHTLKPDDASDRTVVLNENEGNEGKELNYTLLDAIDKSSSASDRGYSNSDKDEDSEPFPDYDESCGQYDRGDIEMLLNIKEQEEAYNRAISKVVEEVIRFREIDARIATLSSSMYDATRASNEAQGYPFAVRHWGSQSTEAIDTTAAETVENNDETRGIVDEIRVSLANPDLKESTREYFIAMTDMVLHMNMLLFPTPAIPVYPTEHLTDLILVRATNIALHLTEYLLVMKKQLKGHIDNAKKVDRTLSRDMRDRSIQTHVAFRHVLHVVKKYLNPPDPLEKRLLSLFFELYDTYVYSAFLNMRPLLQTEVELADEKRELSRVLVSLWDVINQDIEKYDEYDNRAKAIKCRYIDALGAKLKNESPEAWQKFWESQRKSTSREGLQEPAPGAGIELGGSEPFVIPGGFI